jgi:hypothetical protein
VLPGALEVPQDRSLHRPERGLCLYRELFASQWEVAGRIRERAGKAYSRFFNPLLLLKLLYKLAGEVAQVVELLPSKATTATLIKLCMQHPHLQTLPP